MSWNNISDPEYRNQRRNSGHHNYHYDDSWNRYNYHRPGKFQAAWHLLKRIWSDRKLRVILIFSVLILKGLIILGIILIASLTGKMVDFVDQEGIKGVLESVNGIIERIWNGARKV